MLAYLPVESVIRSQQEAYYAALAHADRLSEATPFVEFMLQALAQALAEAKASEPVTLAEFGAMCRELGWDVPVLRETTRGLVDRETGELVLSPVEV